MVNIASISQQIWDMKYRLKAPANDAGVREPIDKTIEDTWRRVATALASVEKDPAPGSSGSTRRSTTSSSCRPGRVIAGAGSAREVTLFNCFVMGAIPDDMGGIFAHLREAALTMQQGGGIGYDFSTLRPKGALVKGVGADASGPLQLHGRVGRDVPHDHVGRLSPRRDDGGVALRPPRYRGLYRGKTRAGPAAHVQPVGAGHRRVHEGGRRKRAVGAQF